MTKLKRKYRAGQSPSKRLRNKLSPFFTLVDMVMERRIVVHGSDDALLDIAKQCQALKQEIRDHIDDASVLMEK